MKLEGIFRNTDYSIDFGLIFGKLTIEDNIFTFLYNDGDIDSYKLIFKNTHYETLDKKFILYISYDLNLIDNATIYSRYILNDDKNRNGLLEIRRADI